MERGIIGMGLTFRAAHLTQPICQSGPHRIPNRMNTLAWLAIVLIIGWIILRMALAITTGLLHLLWIAALVMFVIWAYGKLKRKVS